MEIELPATGTPNNSMEKLSVVINDLINHDFENWSSTSTVLMWMKPGCGPCWPIKQDQNAGD
ncbi:MAG: hypothetical protein IPM91_04675 [Bacteroidetes bacterium]|nr:hypothetical protein [Bacteroidota bacterium]